jgi:hypothetical protein
MVVVGDELEEKLDGNMGHATTQSSCDLVVLE